MNERLEAIISGRVQMVMYRDFAARKARRLGLTGEVKNLPDGTVRVIAEGLPPKLDLYLKALWRGSLLASVEGVRATRLPATGEFGSFSIAYD